MVSKARQYIRRLYSGLWFCGGMEDSFILQPATQGCRYIFPLQMCTVSGSLSVCGDLQPLSEQTNGGHLYYKIFKEREFSEWCCLQSILYSKSFLDCFNCQVRSRVLPFCILEERKNKVSNAILSFEQYLGNVNRLNP